MKNFGVPPMAAWIELWEHIIQSLPCVRGGGSYGGIAAEIVAKNMPPACFLNAPTEGLSGNRQSPSFASLDSPLYTRGPLVRAASANTPYAKKGSALPLLLIGVP